MRKNLVYRLLLAAVSVALVATTTRRYRGIHRIPKSGAAIVACNHISLADPPVLADAVARAGRLPRSLAMAELFGRPMLGRLFRAMGHIPVYRGTAAAAEALEPAKEALEKGEVVIVYPEGGIGRGVDLWPGRGKTGVARLALQTGVPVIPVAQWGVQKVLPHQGRLRYARILLATLRRPRVQLLVGDPITLTGDPNRPEDVRAATDRIMAAIEEQLTQLRGPRAA